MKIRYSLFYGSWLVLSLGTVHAAPIIWEAATQIGADSQVATAGSSVYAHTQANAAATVNGVAFSMVNSSTNWGSGNVTLAFPASTGTHTSTFGVPTGISADYGNLTKGAAFGGSGTGTVTLNKLGIGRAYLAQIWVNDSRTAGSGRSQTVSTVGGNSVILDYNHTNAVGGAGQFALGRFTADATTQSMTLTSSSGGSVQLNALQLREITNLGHWVGSAGPSWDASTTSNFASNPADSPLVTNPLNAVAAAFNVVTFADAYWNSGTATPVSQTAVTVGAGGVSIGRVYFDNHAVNYTLTSADANGISGSTVVFKNGTGTLTMAGDNTYTGATWINAGTLNIQAQTAASTYTIASGATLSLSAGSVINARSATFAGTGTLRIANGVTFGGVAPTTTVAMGSAGLVLVTGNVSVQGSSNGRGRWEANQGSLQVDAGSTINFVEAGSTTTDLGIRVNALNGGGVVRAGHTSGNGFRTLVVGVAGASGSFSGELADRGAGQLLALRKEGAGTQTLSGLNTYTGVTTMAGGILNAATFTDYGTAGPLGARTAEQEAGANIGLRFMGGTLQYTGSSAQSTNRQIRLGLAGGTIDASGTTPTATLSFTHSAANTDLFDTAGTRTLTLSGSNTGPNTFAIRLEDQSTNATSLTKSGTGTWVLTGNSSYSGVTSVNAGVLRIASLNALGAISGRTSVPGGESTNSRLELSGGLVFPAEPLELGARQAAAANLPHLSNVSGDNRWTGPITTTTGGSNYNLESQAGLLTISGSVSLSQPSTRVLQLMGAGHGNISGAITAGATTVSLLRKLGDGTWTLSGQNTYSGNTSVNAGTLTLASTGQLRFVPTTNGTSNRVTGPAAGTATFVANGKFLLDLSAADSTVGNAWLLVEGANVNESYGEAFQVDSSLGAFNETSPGVWELTNAGKKWSFSESTGTLSISTAVVDDYASWSGPSGFNLTGGAAGDDDGDGLSNFQEYAFGLNPTSASSVNPITQALNPATGLFTYSRRATPATSGITYTYESSTTLGGAWTEFVPDAQTSNASTPMEEVTVDVPNAQLAEPRLFIRVKASKP